jgi:hypothetical protein
MGTAVGEKERLIYKSATSCKMVTKDYHQVRINTTDVHFPDCGKSCQQKARYTKLFNHKVGRKSKQAKA